MQNQQLRDRDLKSVLFDLESDNEATRRQAIFASVKLGERAIKAIPVLQQIAGSDPSVELRYLSRKALNALAQLAGPTQGKGQVRKSAGVTKLIAMEAPEMVAVKLASPDPNVRASALRAAAMKQDKALLGPLLTRIGAEKEPDPELRSILVRVIAILGGKEQIKAIAVFLEDNDARVRGNAVETLAGLKDVNGFAYIVKALQDKDHRVQQAAITTLHAVGSLNLLKICSFMLKAEPYWARDSAAYCLAVAKLPDAVPILEAALCDQYESVRIKAKAGLEQLAALGVEPAKTALQKASGIKANEAPTDFLALETAPAPRPADEIASTDATARRRATRNLAVLGMVDDGHLPMLLARLKAEMDVPTIANLIKAVGQIKNAVVLPVLKEYVQHESPDVRGAAVEALGSIATDEAHQMILSALKDPEPQVIGKAALALKNYELINLEQIIESLAKHPNVDHRRMAAFIISEVASPKHQGVLALLAQDSDAGIAAMARETAAMLGAPPSLVPAAAPIVDAAPVATMAQPAPAKEPAQTEAAPSVADHAGETAIAEPVQEALPEAPKETSGAAKKNSKKKFKPQPIDLPSWSCLVACPFILIWLFSGRWGWLGLATWVWMFNDADKRIPWRHVRGVLAAVGSLAWFVVVPLYALVVSHLKYRKDPKKFTFEEQFVPASAAGIAIIAAFMFPRPSPSPPVVRSGTEYVAQSTIAPGSSESARKAEAIDCAKTLVNKTLKAPGTARWVSAVVVGASHPRYLVHVVVDAQNEYGALIRGSFMACVELSGGGKFEYNPMFGVHNCGNPPEPAEIEFAKKLNKWPGHDPGSAASSSPPTAVPSKSEPAAETRPAPTVSPTPTGPSWLPDAASLSNSEFCQVLETYKIRIGTAAANQKSTDYGAVWSWLEAGVGRDIPCALREAGAGLSLRNPPDERFISLCERAAAKGEKDSAYLLALAFAVPDSPRYNARMAIKWLKRAVELGHGHAMLLLGAVYYHGQADESKDHSKAFALLSQALEGQSLAIDGIHPEYADSEALLGVMYAFGQGCQKNEERALHWLNRAKEHGSSKGDKLITALRGVGYQAPTDAREPAVSAISSAPSYGSRMNQGSRQSKQTEDGSAASASLEEFMAQVVNSERWKSGIKKDEFKRRMQSIAKPGRSGGPGFYTYCGLPFHVLVVEDDGYTSLVRLSGQFGSEDGGVVVMSRLAELHGPPEEPSGRLRGLKGSLYLFGDGGWIHLTTKRLHGFAGWAVEVFYYRPGAVKKIW